MGIDTRDRIVAAGLELFARHGFGQVGLDQIVQQAKLTKTTFYNHFESKEQLIREVIDLHEASVRTRLSEGVEEAAGQDTRGRLSAVFAVLQEMLATNSIACHMLITAAAEYPSEHDPIHKAAARNKSELTAMIADLARAAHAPRPEELAGLLSQLLHGAVLDRMLHAEGGAGAAHARTAAELVINAALA